MRAGVWGILLGLSLAAATAASAQIRTDLGGEVVDSATAAALAGVDVTLVSGGAAVATATTDDRGRFRLARVSPGTYQLRLARIGYRAVRLDGVRVPAGPRALRIALVAVEIPLDPVVVSASRTEQTRLDAPASVTVLDRRRIADAPALTPLEHVAEAPGVDAARKGILQTTYAVRGDVSANSGALLTLTDYRYADVPSLAINVPYLIPAVDDDIDRIELERGPGSALYGPNSARGVLLILTRSPLESTGGSLSVTGGTRSLFQGSGRYAFTLGDRVGIKLSGQYTRANDWPYVDPTEDSLRTDSITSGGDPATLLIGKRDFHLERGSAEVRADWRPAPNTTAIFTAGLSDAVDIIDQTTVGAAQARDWRYGFLQGRLRRDRFFANLVYNQSDAGRTYFLRSGKLLVDRSRVLAAEAQDGARVGPADVVYGADVRWTDPRTDSTIDGANEGHDQVTELGVYASTTTALGRHADLVAALRGDHHSRLADFVLSPRVGIVVKPTATGAFRIMYNRAYTSPDANSLFLDINEGLVDSRLPYPLYAFAVGVPPTGFTFSHACHGVCMRLPALLGGASVPIDTVLWPAIVAVARRWGDLSNVPPPASGDVGTRLVVVDPLTQRPVPVDTTYVRDVAAPRRTILNTVEVGYKGLLGAGVSLELDGYVNRLDGVVGPSSDITPSVLYDQASLERYLARYLPAAEAKLVADSISLIPVGTIVPTQASSSDILIAQRQGGGYTVWGADVTVRVEVGGGVTVGGSYSWISDDSIPNVRDVGGVALNVPRNKAYVTVGYTNGRAGLTAQVKGRAIESFPVSSGIYTGRVAGYVVLDATAGARLPFAHDVRLQLTAYNVLGNRHREFVGAPVLGRLVLTELHLTF